MGQEIHVACSTDDNYVVLCGVMLCSLLENNRHNRFCIHILIHNLSPENQIKLRKQICDYESKCFFHEIDEKILDGCQYRTKLHPLSHAAYYRILLSTLLPDQEKVLYLDCDMIVKSDVREIYSLNLDDYGVAAVIDYGLPANKNHYDQLDFSKEDEYFNSGFLLINLKYWRDNNCEENLLNFSKRDRIVYFHDQDALNYVFKKSWKKLPAKWNHLNVFHIRLKDFLSTREEYIDFWRHPAIIHFSDKCFKPWFRTSFIPYKKEWIKYLNLSEWQGYRFKKSDQRLYTVLKVFYVEVKMLAYRLFHVKYWI